MTGADHQDSCGQDARGPRSGQDGRGPRRFPCQRCGAQLEFAPGTSALRCAYCGFENPIPESDRRVEELDFRAHLAELAGRAETVDALTVKCQACAAEVSMPQDVTSHACPFCGSNVVATASSRKLLKPRSLLPFRVTRVEAVAAFGQWLKKLWFAPSKLKQFARLDGRLSGVYTPYWTYDCEAFSRYTGQRGDNYWVTETYTAIENGKPVMRTRQVQRIRWTPVSGSVEDHFDDVLIIASRSLPRENAVALEPWDLKQLVPYGDEYLSGFGAESYQIDLAEGFANAQAIMEQTIRATVCRDIGGDHQQIDWLKTRHENITFKHILLPVWISAYRFRQKVYRILVNARTGEVQGERPWSWAKIGLTIAAAVAVIATIAIVATRS